MMDAPTFPGMSGISGSDAGGSNRAREERSIATCGGECVPPADAFAVVASETRLHILEALWRSDDDAVRFSDLHGEVDLRDSAQFNYHLDKLTDQFVAKTDEGYALRHAGESVVRSVLAGTFTESPDLNPIDVGHDCVDCGSGLRATYADERLAIECPDCGASHGRYSFPPGGLNDRTDAEVLDAFDQRVRHLHCLAADGVCPECNGRMATRIAEGASGDHGTDLGLSVRVVHECAQCRHRLDSPVGLSLLDTAAVVAFYEERGTDLTATPYWTLPWCVCDEYVSVVDRDPYRVRVRIPGDEETLFVTLDESLDIVATERR